jgi:hypothetical protein
MRTHVEFRSSKFSAYEGEEEQVNPGLWGKRLAEYLSEHLQKAEIQTGQIYAEDWGWVIPLAHDPFPLWIGCGRHGEQADGYLVFMEPSTPTIRKFFKKIDTIEVVERVTNTLDEILNSDPEIQGIRWRTEDEK